jgi:predicted AAA+ superfamily ATPase
MKKLIKLIFIHSLDKALRSDSDLLQVILGPRQVGKTTSVLDYLEREFPKKHLYFSADSILNASPEWLREAWQQARREQKILVVDEIQKCQNWSEVVKSLWDESKRAKQKVRCVLLGSSSLHIQKGLSESLTGRFQLHVAYHWNAAESKEGYGLDLESYLKHGGYPGSYDFLPSDDWAKYVSTSIVATVIEKDILQFQTVKNPALFRQAFEIIMAYPAMEISYTKLLGQLQNKGNVEIVKYYLDLYQGAFLIKILEKFSPNQIKTKSSSPKILPLAPCFYYLTQLDDYSQEERGRVFESIVGSQLLRTGHDLFYWREGKYEVDFVLKKGKSVWGIEVKSGRRRNVSGVEAFLKKFPKAKAVILSFNDYEVFEKDPMKFLEA